jgi:hypothetical protein
MLAAKRAATAVHVSARTSQCSTSHGPPRTPSVGMYPLNHAPVLCRQRVAYHDYIYI